MIKIITFLLFWMLSSAGLAPLVFAAVGNVEKGEKIYFQHCRRCHGDNGEGNGSFAKSLLPRPTNFADAIYKYKSTLPDDPPTDKDLLQAMIKGLPGTSMKSWTHNLKDEERWDVIAYIKKLGKESFNKKIRVIDYSDKVASSPESIAKGKGIYFKKAKCNECHGNEGRGDSLKALKDENFGTPLWPRNLTQPWTFRAGSTAKDIYTRVTVGISGTSMVSFAEGSKALTNKERWHLANYVVSLSDKNRRVAGSNDIIKAMFMKQVPLFANDPKWGAVKGKVVSLEPQLLVDESVFFPTNTTMFVKSVFDESKIVFLLEWDDRTRSVEGDKEVIRLYAGGDLFQDAVSIQFPQATHGPMNKPYYGHGDLERGVNILYWGAGNIKERNKFRLYDAFGYRGKFERSAKESGFTGDAIYTNGVWKVLMIRNLKTSVPNDLDFVEKQFIAIAFAGWDGSNLENGSRHTHTKWYRLVLMPVAP